MRLMGLDVGDRRIGVAVSDELSLFAQGLLVLERRGLAADLSALGRVIAEKDVRRIVVGMPRNMNGSYGPQAEKTAAFMKSLETSCDRPCVAWDERLTTRQAERVLISADQRRSKRKTVRDKLAAQLILQSYLDHQRLTAEDHHDQP
ncbi:MAG: Holliday junction resolvase RuvX [Candidatus Tectomicrobia bacterium]|nr:Holliday junction resolvase RuvX [Candidatus Tectomicrobia bacterium]